MLQLYHPTQVKAVMIQNIEKVTQRGEKLEDLGERAGREFLYRHTHTLEHITLVLHNQAV